LPSVPEGVPLTLEQLRRSAIAKIRLRALEQAQAQAQGNPISDNTNAAQEGTAAPLQIDPTPPAAPGQPMGEPEEGPLPPRPSLAPNQKDKLWR